MIKGDEKNKKIDLVMPDLNIESLNVSFVEGETYLLHLYKNPAYGNKAYSLSTISQGQFRITDSDEIVVNNKTVKLEDYKKNLRKVIKNK